MSVVSREPRISSQDPVPKFAFVVPCGWGVAGISSHFPTKRQKTAPKLCIRVFLYMIKTLLLSNTTLLSKKTNTNVWA